MWRSIGKTSQITKNLGKKLIYSQNPSIYSSKSQVFHHKCFNSPSNCSNFIRRIDFCKSGNQNVRFSSQSTSSVSEFESENHELGCSSSDGEVENQTHDVESSQVLNFDGDFDGIGENNNAQMSGFDKIDEFGCDFDGIGVNYDAQMSELEEGISGETVNVEKLENVLSLLQSSVDGSLEGSLNDLELSLNEEFVVRVIETPHVPKEHLIRFFKWTSSKEEFKVRAVTVLSLLARVICTKPKKKDAYALWDLVKEMGGDSGVVSVELLNQMITVFSELRNGKAVFEVFGKFDELGCVANVDTYNLTIEALCNRAFYDEAALVSQKMLDAGMLPDSEKVGAIISFYCKALRSKEAHAVYLAAKQKNCIPPQRVVNFLISCLSKVNEFVPLAKEILADFSSEARKHAINPFSCVVRGLCTKKDIEGGKKLLLEMIEKGPPPGNAVFNTVINALSKAGEFEDAKEMLKLMESRGLKPDVFSYCVIISGYAKGGLLEDACKVLSDARKKHPKLCPAIFHTLIRGYCKLEQFDKAVKLLSDMNKYGVEPNVDEYNKLIQSLCLKALDWKIAEKLLEEMNTKGLHLPGITRGLINAVKELEQETFGSEDVVTKE